LLLPKVVMCLEFIIFFSHLKSADRMFVCSCKQYITIATSCPSGSSLSTARNIRFLRWLLQYCSATVVARCMGVGMLGLVFCFCM